MTLLRQYGDANSFFMTDTTVGKMTGSACNSSVEVVSCPALHVIGHVDVHM